MGGTPMLLLAIPPRLVQQDGHLIHRRSRDTQVRLELPQVLLLELLRPRVVPHRARLAPTQHQLLDRLGEISAALVDAHFMSSPPAGALRWRPRRTPPAGSSASPLRSWARPGSRMRRASPPSY